MKISTAASDLVTNSYMVSWDSSCEKSWAPMSITSESQLKKKGVLN